MLALLLLVFAAAALARPVPPPQAQAQGIAKLTRPKTQPLPGELRKRADRQFLAHRGIGFGPAAAAARPGIRRSPAESLSLARVQHMSLVHAASLRPEVSSSPGTWQSLGPAQVTTAAYGAVTGRITSLAADPQDSTGNTLYLGSTGGGVWKSTNAAAGSASSVTFVPLTDDLPAFNNTLGSLSIGALTVQPTSANVILAGTGDINDALDSYYGVGILRSADGGNTWTLIGGTKDGFVGGLADYSFVGNGFAGFAWSSVNPNLVVAAVAQSAEGLLVNAGPEPSMRAGLFYSSDAGQTWYMAVIEDSTTSVVQSPNIEGDPPGNSATSVVWNPVRQRFYAAVRHHGYYESLDGVTWTRLANQPGAALAASACPTNPGSTGQTSCPIFRGALAVQPVTGDMFALTTGPCNSADPSCSGPANIDLDQGLYRDVCSTTGLAVTSCASNTVAFGTQIASAALENGNGDTTIPLADYDLTLAAVSSGQDTILLAGTEDIYRCSLANSCAWRNTTNIQTCASAMVAPSQHATESTFGSTGLIYFANDGGLWRSTDTVGETGSVCASTDASHYQNLNSGIGSLAEIEHFSVSPASPTTLLAGVGGFGTASTTTGTGAWPQILTGEGSYTAIDPADVENWYSDAGAGADILRCTQGASCNAAGFGTTPAISSSQVEDDADYFDDPAPWILDPLNTANLLLGTCRVWRGPAIGGWSSSNLLSPMLDGDQEPFCDGNAEIRSIGAGLDSSAPAGSEEMYAGIAGPYDGGGLTPGHLFASTVPLGGGLTTWTDRYSSTVTNSSNDPQFNEGGFAISSIAVDPHDPTGQTVYVTIQGFSGNGINGGTVYGSTNGGQTWLNLTNSLPLSPANSVIVDPNVASIVYVALDTGVYYTENVTDCANQALTCWAVYGSGLPNAPVTNLQIYSSGGSSILEAATYGRGIWALGLQTAPAQGTLSPASYSYASEPEGSTAAAATFTLHNTGAIAMVITDIEAVGDYSETNNCGSSLAASAGCTISVTFTPTASGDRPGYLYVYSNVSGGRLSSTLDGTGLAPGTVTVTPTSLSFPQTAEGASSTAQTLTIANTGGVAVTLQSLTVTTDYQLSANSCGTTLAPGGSCSVSITFTPSALGDRPGHLVIPSNLASSPTLIPLDGIGVPPAALTLAPTSLTFPNTAVGSVSAAQTMTVTNSGGSTADLATPTVSGDYQIQSTTCGATLVVNATCVIQIAFAPQATGSRPGLLLISANIAGSDVTAALSGTGLAPASLSLSPASLTFAYTTLGTTAATQSIQLTSTGGVSVQLQTPSVTGDYAISATTCGTSLAPGATCTLQISFTPTAAGDRPGLLTVPTNVANASVTAALDGTGVGPPALTLSPGSLTFSATGVGATTVAQTVSVTNTGGSAAQLQSESVSGDYAISANSCPSTLAAGAGCAIQITFTPTATGDRPGVLTLPADIANSPVTAVLDGTGADPPTVTLSPSPAPFLAVSAGADSTSQPITVTNSGSIAATLTSQSVTGDYQISSTTCIGTLAAGDSCVIEVISHPLSVGGSTGLLTVTGSMLDGQVTDTLNGSGSTATLLTLSPGEVSYTGLVGGTYSLPAITVTNTDTVDHTLPAATISGDYATDYAISSDTCAGATLAPGDTCSIQIIFTPSGATARPAQLQQEDGVSGDPAPVVSLDGIGVSPGSLAITPSPAAFGSVVVGATSNTTLTATNTGGVTVNLQTATITGDFAITSNSCGSTLAANADCTLQVTFTPTVTGSRTGALTLPSSAANSPAVVSLTGTGLAQGAVSLSPTSLTFTSTVVGATSATQTVTATNSGGVSVALGAPAATGDYEIASTTCTGTLAASSSCTLQVAFSPMTFGARTGTLSLTGAAATVNLDGLGVAAGTLTLSPTSLAFGSVIIGTSSPSKVVTVANPGGVAVAISAIATVGDYSLASNNCPASLAAGGSCTLQIVFTPGATADREGLLKITGSLSGGDVTASLDGSGVAAGQMSLSTSLLSFGQVVVGQTSAVQTLTLSNTGGSSLPLLAPVFSSSEYAVTATTCAGNLDVGQQCTLSIVFQPTATGDQPGTITVSASGGAISAQASVDGSGISPVQLAFAPSSLAFGSVVQGQTSAQQSVTLTNSGSISAQLKTPTISGDFAIASNHCGNTLAAAAGCTMQITFSPTATGSRTGTLTASASNSASPASVALSGTGTPAPSLVLTPTTLTFTATAVGVTSAVQNVTVANTGSANVNLLPFTLAGDFVLSADTCSGVPLKPNYSCTLSINFAPTAGGARSGVLTVASSTESHTVALNGTGLTPATDTLSPTSLTFGSQIFGTVSAAQSVTLTNSGGLTLGSIATAVAGPFVATNNCGTILGGGLTCSIAVSYAPTAAGAQTGQLTVSDAIRSQTIGLTGTGVLATSSGAAAVATPVTYAFGGYAVGGTTPQQTVTVTNTGTVALAGFTAATATTTFNVAANSCSGTLAPGASCTVGVTFTPQQPGNAVDQLTLSSPSLGSPLSVALSGSGESFLISIVGASSAIVTNGQTTTFKLSVTPVGISAGTVAVACSGVPASAVCTLNPASLSLAGGAAGSITATIATGTSATAATEPSTGRGLFWTSAGGLALLLPCLFAGGRGRRRFMLLALSVAVVLAPAACGVHASDGTTGTTGGGGSGTTPPGTYAVTVTATYPGAQLTATFNLTVE